MSGEVKVICAVHFCDKHEQYKCKCVCMVCTQVADDFALLKQMQEADHPGLCEEHDWPGDLTDGAKCGACGLPYDEWTEF